MTMENDDIKLENAILYADSSRGVYIPQYFAESIKRECVSGVSDEQWGILVYGPYQKADDLGDAYWHSYWDAWCDVECSAIVTDPITGIRYTLWQDGNLWLVPC